MERTFSRLLLAVLTALLLVQPAVLAGASCATEMLTGACGCTEVEAQREAGSCCSDEASDAAPAGECDCSLAPVPHEPLAPVEHGPLLSGAAAARAWIDLAVATPARGVLHEAGFAATRSGAPPGAHAPPRDLTRRAELGRILSFLGTSLR